jgi:hypothetical protein
MHVSEETIRCLFLLKLSRPRAVVFTNETEGESKERAPSCCVEKSWRCGFRSPGG